MALLTIYNLDATPLSLVNGHIVIRFKPKVADHLNKKRQLFGSELIRLFGRLAFNPKF